MKLKAGNKITNKLLIQMIAVVLIIGVVFYTIISMQAKESKKRIFDKARLFSVILSTYMNKVVDDNIIAYQSLQIAVNTLAEKEESVEEIKIIALEYVILASTLTSDIWKPVEPNSRAVIEQVINSKKASSIVKAALGQELVIHSMPLFSEETSGKKLIGVMQMRVKFSAQQASAISGLRTNKRFFFKKKAAEFANGLAKELREILYEVEINSNYLDEMIKSMLEDEEIKDIRLFSEDLKLLGSGSLGRYADSNNKKQRSLYKQAMAENKVLSFTTLGTENLIEIVSPMFQKKGKEKKVNGIVGIVLSLERIETLISSRRNMIIVMSLVIIFTFCLLIGIFFKITIIAPVNELMKIAQKIGAGDFTQKATVKSEDEIGDLARVFNQMSAELQRSKKEIEGWNVKLQEKVDKVSIELREKQAQLLEVEKMASLGILSSGIAHEINNPIGIILGNAQMLLEKLNTGQGFSDTEEAGQLLSSIEDYSRRCSHIINSLLQFSRSKEMQFKRVDIVSAVESALVFASAGLEAKQIEIMKNFSSKLPFVQADAIQLEQVFINILHNAEHSISEKGKIELTVSLKKTKNKKDKILVSFKDNGVGIPKGNLNKIFEPFFTTREPGKGVGLGLAISYGIIKAHKGEIEVKSIEKEWTEILVSLPVEMESV